MRLGKALPLRPVAFLLVLAVAGPAVFAGGAAEEEAQQRRADLQEELSEEEPAYSVAIAAVVAPEAKEGERDTLSSYAEVVRDLATGPPTRYLDDRERRGLREERLARYRRQLLREIDERRNVLERRRLERTTSLASSDSGDEQQLRELRAQYELLSSITPQEVPVPREIPVDILDESYRFRRTLPTAAGLVQELPEVDLILYLTVEPVSDRLLLRVHAYDVLFRRDRELFRLVGTPEELSLRLESRERDVVEAIAGRALGGIQVSVADDQTDGVADARVFVGDRYLGVAPVEERYLPPGTYTVRTEGTDGRSVSQAVEIATGGPQAVRLVMSQAAPEMVTIRTKPSGARVYRGSVWVGFTPVEVPRPLSDTSYTVVQEGYYDSRVMLTAASPLEVERAMVSAESDWATEVTDARDRFYRSFGFFALSVGVPILMNGMYQNFSGLVDEGGSLTTDLAPEEQGLLLRQANVLYVGYYASLGLSVGFFGNMMWRLVTYVQTAQGYHTR